MDTTIGRPAGCAGAGRPRDQTTSTIIDSITQAARTGQVGDGKIFVWNLSEAIRIRTGETGDAAV